MDRARFVSGWTHNLIRAGRLEPGERVLVVVDEPLRAQGEDPEKRRGRRTSRSATTPAPTAATTRLPSTST
jgi:hypothetical protein